MIHHDSTIFRTAASFLKPILLVAAVVLLFRGHNAPGGGFIGGLVAAAAFSLHALAHGTEATRRALRREPERLIGFGLLLSGISGVLALVQGKPYLTGVWTFIDPLGGLPFGTIILFDVGVFFVVLGMVTLAVFNLIEWEGER